MKNDRIVFLKNAKFSEKKTVKNGQTARILEIDKTQIKVQFEDGKKLTFNKSEYACIAHTYAITTHKSQGYTVDHAAILGGGNMQSLNQSYMQLGRVRHGVDLVLPKAALEKEMYAAEPTTKMLELAQKKCMENKEDIGQLDSMSMLECRDFIGDGSKGDKERWREDIGALIDKMGEVDIKVSTLDFDEAPQQLEAAPNIQIQQHYQQIQM